MGKKRRADILKGDGEKMLLDEMTFEQSGGR